MNTESINFKCIVESDSNPTIVFDNRGHILYLNSSAEILLGYTDRTDLFSLATQYAPIDFGSKTVPINLHYSHLSFYAVNICYDSEEWIALKMFYRPRNSENRKIDRDSFISTDINLILEATLSMFRSEYNGKIVLMTDRDMPSFKLHQNNISKLLRKALNSFKDCDRIDISLMMGIGESIIVENEKFQVVRIRFVSDKRDQSNDFRIETLCSDMNIVPIFDDNRIILDIPFIK